MNETYILLAQSLQGSIVACQCGRVHIAVGDTTSSFSLEEFVVMLELHQQAINTLEANIAAVRDLCSGSNFQQPPGKVNYA